LAARDRGSDEKDIRNGDEKAEIRSTTQHPKGLAGGAPSEDDQQVAEANANRARQAGREDGAAEEEKPPLTDGRRRMRRACRSSRVS
jgi:hypothetical protein